MHHSSAARGVRLGFAVLLLDLACRTAAAAMTTPPLAPCPETPNCVSSLSDDPDRRVAPIAFTGDAAEAFARLARLVEATPRTRVVERRPDYLRVEFTSRLFGFVDDVELVLDAPGRVIQVRSASRVGYWDLGANRRRVEDLRERFSGA
ncbi:MAG: DUF1499 domain-containing protein [Gammaproteobacteria bacterium]|nr:DUF1499 domain-containing protein [Gammaproteobacteria bacterium]